MDTRVITSVFQGGKNSDQGHGPGRRGRGAVLEGDGPDKSALDVADYKSAISWASQTALRDVIGKTQLSDMLEGREKLGRELQKIIDERTEPWGINVISVEVKDVLIPPAWKTRCRCRRRRSANGRRA